MCEVVCAKHEKQHKTDLKIALFLEHVLLEQYVEEMVAEVLLINLTDRDYLRNNSANSLKSQDIAKQFQGQTSLVSKG